MPLVEVPEVGTVEFPDSMSQDEIVTAIERDIIAKRQPSLQVAIPEPGQEGPAMLSRPLNQTPTQAFPTTPQPAPERPIKYPQPTQDELLQSGVRQMPEAPEAQVELPRFGEPGTMTRGVSDVAAGLGEWALNRPEEFVGTLLNPAVKAAVELRYVPEIAYHFVKDVVAGAKGDKEAAGRALAIFATVAAPKAASIAKREIKTAQAKTAMEGEAASLRDLTARGILSPDNAQIRLPEQKALPATDVELRTGTDPASTQFQNAPDRGERGRLLKSMRPEVPATPPEPQRDLNVIEEIRQRGADTRRKVQAMFPHLKNEEAAALRDQAFPRTKVPDNLPKSEAERLFLDDLNRKSNEEIASAEPLPEQAKTPVIEEAKVTEELPSRASDDAGKPPAEPAPVRNLGVAPAEFIGRQEGFEGIEPFDLYNLTEPIGNLEVGSTVSGKTIENLGYKLPEKNKPAPPSTEQAPPTAAPLEAAESKANPPDVTALEVPPAMREPTPAEKPAQTAPAEKKIVKQVKQVAREDGPRAATEIKSELVTRIEKAIEEAPLEADVKASSYTEVGGKRVETPDSATSIEISIPGDGDFKIRNTKEALGEILKRAQKISTKSTEPVKVKRSAAPTREQGKEFLKEAEIEPPAADTGTAGAAPARPGAPIATIAPTLSRTPKSQRQIITDLAKGLKLPIRFGRIIKPQFGGYFQKVQDLIASKFANDIPVVTHEAGHKLDAEFGFSADAALRPELDRLGDPATPGSMSSWKPKKSQSYKMGEGVAEFVRYWMVDPAKAKAEAPNTFKRFEEVLDANKDFGDVMRQGQQDIQLWRSAQPQARFRSHISTRDNPNGTRYTLDQLTRDTIDDLHFLRLATDDAMRYRTAPLEPSNNAYQLARALRGSYGMADTFVRTGVVDFETKSVRLGTSLEDALKPVAGRLDDFRDWIVAKRAQELETQGKRTGFLKQDVDFVANKFNGDATFVDAFTKVKEWQDALLQYAVDAGLVTDAGAKAMRNLNEDYVPFHRIFEVGAGEPPAVQGGGVGKGLNAGTPGSLRKLKGSARDIVDPIETMVKNSYVLITAAEKANIHRALADYANMPKMGKWVEKVATPKDQVKVGLEKIRKQLEDVGADLTVVPDDLMLTFFQNSKQAPFGENMIRIVRDGKPEFYRLNKDLFETFHALDLEDAGAFIRFWSQGAQILRSGVVLEPSFGLANALRDTVSAAVLSKYGALPFEVTLRGVGAMMRNPKLVAEWAAAGGKNSVEAAYFDREKMQRILRERVSKDLTPAEKATIIVRSPLTALRWLTEKAEEATRIGEYQKAYNQLRKSGMPEGDARRLAAFEARDRQDFAKGGAKTKIIRRVTPFWNAALQSNVKLASSLKNNPARTIMQGIAFVTIPKLLEQAVNYDDPDYWDRPQWERDLFFLIPFDKDANGHTKFIRIPTPFEIGVLFGTLPGRLIQYAKDQSEPATEAYLMTLLKAATPNAIPPVEKTIIETALTGKQGWDIYRGREIVPDRLSNLPADLQWTEQNSLTAKKLGSMLGVSPMKVDHVIRSTTGGLGQLAVHQGTDRLISAATGEERTARGKAPGGRFVTTPAGVMSQSVETFYDYLGKINGEAQRQKMTGRAADYVLLKEDFNRAAEQMSDLRKAARATNDDNVRQLYQLQIADIAKDMNRMAREFGLK